jgi:ankyrin repeat protein
LNGALLKAVNGKYLRLCKFLVSKGADPNFKNKKGFSSLYFATKSEIRDIIFFLLQSGANCYDDGLAGFFF